MKISAIKGIIERRILINYRVDTDIISNMLPAPFKPKTYRGKAIAGICLIRLKKIRPKGFPGLISISSENGAHRIAVQWKENGAIRDAVFIPRRDTSSRINSLVGGRIFPGRHHYARFDVREENGHYHVGFQSADGTTIAIDADKATHFATDSIFENIENASEFFECGSVGYSPSGNKFDGLNLKTLNWKVQPLDVLNVQSTFFEDEAMFPKGSVHFDNALLMTHIEHEWHALGSLKE